MDCLFCKIIKGEIPSYKIYEDEYTYAFLDIAKDFDGHTVVVPKKHSSNLLETDVDTLTHLMSTVQKISNHYVNECGYEGVNVLNNCNECAGQSVMHIHFHIVPRTSKEKFSLYNEEHKSNADLEKMCNELKLK